MRAIIFDLDLTMVDSVCAAELRSARNWQAVYRLIPHCTPYDGISELITELKSHQVKICVVTSSPRPYCEKMLLQWDWRVDHTVCFHDTTLRKPHPAPMLRALSLMGVGAEDTLSIGDEVKDVLAARAANIPAVAALWGATDRGAVLNEKPDYIAEAVADLQELLMARL